MQSLYNPQFLLIQTLYNPQSFLLQSLYNPQSFRIESLHNSQSFFIQSTILSYTILILSTIQIVGLNYFNKWVFVDPGRLIQNLEKDQERKQSAFQTEQDPKPKTNPEPEPEPEPEPCFQRAEEKMDYLGYLNLVTHDKKNGNIQILELRKIEIFFYFWNMFHEILFQGF